MASSSIFLYDAEDCVCTHAADLHEDDLGLNLVHCTHPDCDCKVYWPASRHAEFLRRRAFVNSLNLGRVW